MAALVLGFTGIAGGTYINYRGQEQALETTLEGAEAQSKSEEQGREFTQKIFDAQAERQQPFVDIGNLALPELVNAIQNRGPLLEGPRRSRPLLKDRPENLPSKVIRRDIVGDFLGDQAPEFIKQNTFADINAEETEINKGRLQNLVNLGVGGVGGTAQTGSNLASDLGSSFLRDSDIKSQSLQDQATARQNQNASILRSLSALPQFAVAAGRR